MSGLYPYPSNLNVSAEYFDRTCPKNYFLSQNCKYGDEGR